MRTSVYLLLCVGLMHIGAHPAPQNSDDFTTIDPSDELARQEASTSIPIEPDQEAETEPPILPEESGNGDEESGNEDELETKPDEEPNPDDTEASDDTPGANTDDQETNDEDATAEGNSGLTPESDDENPGPSDGESSDDSDENDVDPKKDENEGGEVKELGALDLFEHRVRATLVEDDYNKNICQMIYGTDNKVLDQRCLVAKSFFSVIATVVPINIFGSTFLCQIIYNTQFVKLTELCVTNTGYIFNPLLFGEKFVLF